MLRLVKPKGPKPPRRKGERKPLLTPEEERRFRQAMRNLPDAFGTWGALAAAMDANEGTIDAMRVGRSRVSGDMIVRAMRASGLSLADPFGVPRQRRSAVPAAVFARLREHHEPRRDRP